MLKRGRPPRNDAAVLEKIADKIVAGGGKISVRGAILQTIGTDFPSEAKQLSEARRLQRKWQPCGPALLAAAQKKHATRIKEAEERMARALARAGHSSFGLGPAAADLAPQAAALRPEHLGLSSLGANMADLVSRIGVAELAAQRAAVQQNVERIAAAAQAFPTNIMAHDSLRRQFEQIKRTEEALQELTVFGVSKWLLGR